MFLVVIASRDVGWLQGRIAPSHVSGGWSPDSNHSGLVRAQDSLCGICGGQDVAGTGFSRVLGFSLLIVMQQTIYNYWLVNLGW